MENKLKNLTDQIRQLKSVPANILSSMKIAESTLGGIINIANDVKTEVDALLNKREKLLDESETLGHIVKKEKSAIEDLKKDGDEVLNKQLEEFKKVVDAENERIDEENASLQGREKKTKEKEEEAVAVYTELKEKIDEYRNLIRSTNRKQDSLDAESKKVNEAKEIFAMLKNQEKLNDEEKAYLAKDHEGIKKAQDDNEKVCEYIKEQLAKIEEYKKLAAYRAKDSSLNKQDLKAWKVELEAEKERLQGIKKEIEIKEKNLNDKDRNLKDRKRILDEKEGK